jgi:hypothetical protein
MQICDLDPSETEMAMPYMSEVLYHKPTQPKISRAEKRKGGMRNKSAHRTDTSSMPGSAAVKPLLMITDGRVGHADFEVDDDDFVDSPPRWHGTPSHGKSPIGDGPSGVASNPHTPYSAGTPLSDVSCSLTCLRFEFKFGVSCIYYGLISLFHSILGTDFG